MRSSPAANEHRPGRWARPGPGRRNTAPRWPGFERQAAQELVGGQDGDDYLGDWLALPDDDAVRRRAWRRKAKHDAMARPVFGSYDFRRERSHVGELEKEIPLAPGIRGKAKLSLHRDGIGPPGDRQCITRFDPDLVANVNAAATPAQA